MVLAAPLLTRLYTPESFGILGVYAALLAIVGVVSSLRFEIAIPLPSCDVDATNLLALGFMSLIGTTLLTCFFVVLAGDQLVDILSVPELGRYLWLLPVGIFLSGTYKILSYWAVRTKSFSALSKTRIAQVFATLSVQVFAFKLGGLGLLLGQAGGQGAGSVSLARTSFKLNKPLGWSWSGVLGVACRYKQFPIFSTWSGLFNTAGTQLPPLLFAGIFGAGPAGLYALAHRVLAMPMSVIGDAIGKVFFSGAAQAHRDGTLDQLVSRGFGSLVKIAFPAALLFMLIAPELFLIVFGENWMVAGEMARWMTPWLLFQFISSPLSTIYFVLQKENYGLMFQVFLLVCRTAAIALGSIYYDFVGVIIAFSLTSAICYFIYIVSIFFLVNLSVFYILRVVFREAFCLMLLSAPPAFILFLGFEVSSLVLIFLLVSIVYFYRLKALY